MRLKCNTILAGITTNPDIADNYLTDARETLALLMETRANDPQITRFEAILDQHKAGIEERRLNPWSDEEDDEEDQQEAEGTEEGREGLEAEEGEQRAGQAQGEDVEEDEMLTTELEWMELNAARDQNVHASDEEEEEMLMTEYEWQQLQAARAAHDQGMLATLQQEVSSMLDLGEGSLMPGQDVTMEDVADSSTSQKVMTVTESDSQQTSEGSTAVPDSQETSFGGYDTGATSLDEEMSDDTTPEPRTPPWQ